MKHKTEFTCVLHECTEPPISGVVDGRRYIRYASCGILHRTIESARKCSERQNVGIARTDGSTKMYGVIQRSNKSPWETVL